MSAIKHTFQSVIVLQTDGGRGFKIVRGEIFEVVRGEGFVATTKVVVREDVVFVAQQLQQAVEI